MITAVKKAIPYPVKQRIRNYLANRGKRGLFGTLAPLVPPVQDMFDGGQNLQEYKQNGEEFLKIYKDLCGLQADEQMLDVGCGIGRKTLPLIQYFNERAEYQGMDVTKAGIEWCRKKITPRYPNFRFQHIDVYNKQYNPSGTQLASAFRFPFAAESFSFVMLGSVFTHMLPADVGHYLSEVWRVLKVGGRCLITYFLLNNESLTSVMAGRSALDFKYPFDKYRVISVDVPEDAIAFEEEWIRSLYHKVGLVVTRLEYGSWCAREHYLSYQDLILSTKV